MSRQVEFSAAATADLLHYYLRARSDAPRTADRWLERFHAAAATLSNLPERFALAPENKGAAVEVRQMIFGKGRGCFRVLFTIEEERVLVLRIARSSRNKISPDELFSGD